MRTLLSLAFCCTAISAQTLTFSIHDNTGATPDVALPAAYQFAPIPQGSSSSIMVLIKNSGAAPVNVILAYVGSAAGSARATPDFTISGLGQSRTLAPGQAEPFLLNFTPSRTGQLLGYLQAVYVTQGSGCQLTSATASTQCPSTAMAVSTIEGTGTAPQILLTYNKGQGEIPFQPRATTRLDFGDTSTSTSGSIQFILANQTSSEITAPAVSVQCGVFASCAFSLDSSKLPATLPANGSASFTISFAPGQTGLTLATLLVGTNEYDIQGTGVVVTDIDALQVFYVDSTGVRTLPQAATPISFGEVVPGSGAAATLKFTITNPAISYNAVTVADLSVTGAAYTLTGGPALPVTIQPNSSISFAITFTAATSGTYTGTLTIGTRKFSMTGLSVVSPVPAMSLSLSEQPLTSAKQVNATVQAESAAKVDAIGELTMEFAPSVSGVTNDPAVVFLATGGRQLQLSLAAGTQAATFNGQSALTFQTGTTAGTITFTLTFPNTAPVTQAYAITPAAIHIGNAQAIRQSPNLIIEVDGFDNTYTAGQLSFTFYDTKGAQINATPMAVDGTSNFHQYFFSKNAVGGSFAMQASFPVTGDDSKIGSVSVTLANSSGQASTKLNFE